MKHFYRLASLLLLFNFFSIEAQEQFSLNGYIRDASNGETLIGTTVYISELGGGTVSNVYGYYSISLPPGEYTVKFQYIGFSTQEKKITLNENIRLEIELKPEETQLEAVEIVAEAEDYNVSEIEMSTAKIDIKTIERMPAFMGEVDIIKSLQLLPGVTTVGEGASGFNVRGGSVGQNLILLDEAPVYNSSHLFGFFSVFNPDAVKDVKLYKGGIPSQYGGRIASILDVRMKEGNAKEYKVNAGVGAVFSRLAVEGPITDRSSFIIAGRRSYADLLVKAFSDVLNDGAGLYFYDLTAKTNYNINDKNRVFLSGYFGRDVFKFDEQQGFDWGNQTTTLRWNHLFSDRLFSNFTFYSSHFDYAFSVGETRRDEFNWESQIVTYDIKPELTYFINPSNELIFGADLLLYVFRPARAYGTSNGERTDVSLEDKRALETALYVGNKQTLSNQITLQYGLRYSGFRYMGDGTVYSYQDPVPGERKVLTGAESVKDWETIEYYQNLEPRFSAKYQPYRSLSFKGSYNRMVQYIHLISNTIAATPIDVWAPSTNNIKPQIGDQFTIGAFKNFRSNSWETSVEFYYRKTRNQVDYIDGADIFINEFLEADLLRGTGRAKGMEVYIRRNEGKVNGWISYSLGKSEIKTPGVNLDQWYPARFDQTHNFKLAAFYDLNKRVSFSANFAYLTGTPTTYPNHRYEIQGMTIPYIEDNLRNQSRIPAYHRLDLSATIQGRKYKKNGKPRRVEDNLVITVYNAYARENPFSVYFAQPSEQRLDPGEFTRTQSKQFSMIGFRFPSIAYNLKF